MKIPKSSTETLIVALREIGNNALNDEEGLITATILEAADRLECLEATRTGPVTLRQEIEILQPRSEDKK